MPTKPTNAEIAQAAIDTEFEAIARFIPAIKHFQETGDRHSVMALLTQVIQAANDLSYSARNLRRELQSGNITRS